MLTRRPGPGDHADYFKRYVDLVPDGDILETLAAQMDATQVLLASVPPTREEYRYKPTKWSLREVVGHVIDVERAFANRCHWIARGVKTDLPSFEQNVWVQNSNAGSRPVSDLAKEWAALRRDNLAMFEGFDEKAWDRTGRASGNGFRALAFPWIIAGHELYHVDLLQRNYLPQEQP